MWPPTTPHCSTPVSVRRHNCNYFNPSPSQFISLLWRCSRSRLEHQGFALITHMNTIDSHHTHTHTYAHPGESMQINPQAEPCYSINVPAPVISALARSKSDDLETTSPFNWCHAPLLFGNDWSRCWRHHGNRDAGNVRINDSFALKIKDIQVAKWKTSCLRLGGLKQGPPADEVQSLNNESVILMN